MKDNHRIIVLSIGIGIFLWILDATVDSYIFYPDTFLGSLIFDIPAHELYYRSVLFISFVLFGLILSRITTKKNKLEEQILHAKNDWENSFDTITDAITIHDKDFNIIRANRASGKLMGLSFNEMINKKKCYEVFHGKNAARSECPSCQALKTGKNSVCEFFEPHLNRFLEIRAIPRFDREGQMTGLIHIVRDITNKRHIEEELKRHREHLMELVEERTFELEKLKQKLEKEIIEHKQAREKKAALLKELKTIFDNFPVGIVYLDNQFTVLGVNRFFLDITGLSEQDLIGKPCYNVAGEYSGDAARQGLEKVCSFCKKEECSRSKKPTVIERPFNDKFIRVTTIPDLDDKGNILRFMEIVEDITERRLAEAEAFRASHLASLGELAAGVAHEINNPVNGIINYSQILVNEAGKGSREYDIAGRIIKEGNRIAKIVNGLLSFARDRKEDKMSVSIHEALSNSLSLTEAQMRKDGIEVRINIPPGLPVIFAHQQQIEQVFLNIITNARYALNQKYNGADSNKALEITGEEISYNNNKYLRIIFHDNGIGIPAGNIVKVLNPFFSTKPANQGTGLGLSISHGIINDHAGRINLESVEGEFTKVLIDLPAAVS
ncbi:MAG: PAS domain-containing protein [Nitrospirae bacterium]|nr:PAS domain-containing protein [Nitrospirota bacterium]